MIQLLLPIACLLSPCSLITPAEASAVLGARVGPTEPQTSADGTTTCHYVAPADQSLRIQVHSGGLKAFEAYVTAFEKAPQGRPQKIRGLGDQAVLQAGQLVVLSRDHFLVLSIGLALEEKDRIRLSIGLARKALSRFCALAQTPPDPDGRIKLALSARPVVGREGLLQFRSPALSGALESPDALWDFLTSPKTPYLDRRAAAVQARDAFPVSFLPKLMAALGELREEEAKDRWGLRAHPLSAVAWDARRYQPAGSRERTVLGHRWVTPETTSDYPLTPEEEAKAPWPWQIHRALDDLLSVLSGQADRQQWLAAALTMPCSTDQEAALFVEATRGHWASTTVLGAWRNIALHPKFRSAASLVPNNLDRAAHAGHVILLDMLRETPHRDARHRAAWEVFRLRELPGRPERSSLPATAVLLLSRMALDPANGDPWTRLYVYAFSAARTLDQPPIDANQRLDPESPRVVDLLKEFDKWFQSNQQNLEQLAGQEAEQLESTRTELATTAKCSP